MNTVTIRFEEVGRERRTWTTRFLALPSGEAGEDLIAREARQALASWDVAAVWNHEGTRGVLYAGSHRVGAFVLVATASPAPASPASPTAPALKAARALWR